MRPEPSDQPVLSPGSSVTVEVPATSANLGPGFDCFGLALDWRERVSLAVIERGYQIDVSGEGAAELPRDESHLIIRSALVGLADLGVTGTWALARLSQHHSARSRARILLRGNRRGPGCCSGTGPAYGWSRTGSSGTRMPSRVIPTMWLRRSMEASSWRTRVEPGSGLRRATLTPRSVPRCSFLRRRWRLRPPAICFPRACPTSMQSANSGRAALLVHALASEPDLLYDATCDWLHQGYREAAMPRSYELMKSLRGQGFAAMISGAGPSVLVLGRQADLAALQDQQANRVLATAQWYRVGRGDPRPDVSGVRDHTVMETPDAGASLRGPTRSGQLR